MPGNAPSCLCGVCKRCKHRKYLREWREQNREKVRENERRYRRENREKISEIHQRYWENHPGRLVARSAVSNAVRNGRIQKGSCEVGVGCRGHIEAHHDDYAKPLDVRWLCQLHHARHHCS